MIFYKCSKCGYLIDELEIKKLKIKIDCPRCNTPFTGDNVETVKMFENIFKK